MAPPFGYGFGALCPPAPPQDAGGGVPANAWTDSENGDEVWTDSENGDEVWTDSEA